MLPLEQFVNPITTDQQRESTVASLTADRNTSAARVMLVSLLKRFQHVVSTAPRTPCLLSKGPVVTPSWLQYGGHDTTTL